MNGRVGEASVRGSRIGICGGQPHDDIAVTNVGQPEIGARLEQVEHPAAEAVGAIADPHRGGGGGDAHDDGRYRGCRP